MHQAELLLRTENERSKSGKETLKIKQCWYTDVLPDKRIDQCIQMLATKTSFQKDKFSIWRHVLPFHKYPASGRSLQELPGDSSVWSICSWEHLSAPGATTSAGRCDTAEEPQRGGISLPYKPRQGDSWTRPRKLGLHCILICSCYHPTHGPYQNTRQPSSSSLVLHV